MTDKEEKIVPDAQLLGQFKDLLMSLNNGLKAINRIKKHKKVSTHSAWETAMKWERRLKDMRDASQDFINKHNKEQQT